ncbi:Sensor histidine kinase [Rubrivivax sp. A210]|uniref:ATP-binding protein n=1 Tax=Rubrivivax sp. A210 TaxID=2772301 RepID=UPI00191955D7|nr:ATP-binding protein [Rubrivivax sp. A210]CAD5373357.1 Sensor histidine kinase [Rubrivivax sp. A210]
MSASFFATQDQYHRRTVVFIWLVALALLALNWRHSIDQIAQARSRELQAAERDLANLTRVGQEHADRTLHSADQVLRFVQARYIEMGRRLDLIKLTEQGIIDAENFPQVGVIDPQGIYILANRPVTGTLDLSDREHFRVHLDPKMTGLFVSKPVLGRATGKWSIQLTRRITMPDGSFGGVAVLSVDPGYFTRFYADLSLGEHGVATLIGLDGIARARHTGGQESFGADLTKSPIHGQLSQGSKQGTYVSRSPLDQIERMFHYRRLARLPLAVAVGLDVQEVLANYRTARDTLLVQASAVSLLVVALAWAMTRYLVRLRRELQARMAVQQQVEERTEQINAIFSLSPDGFVGFDDRGRIKYVNPAFVQMTGDTGQVLEGMDEKGFSQWLSRLCESGARYSHLAPATADSPRRSIVISQGRRVLLVGERAGNGGAVSRILYFRDVTHETEVDQIKSEFLSTAAHELRTPMASIYGFAEVLLTQELDDAERREFTAIIFEQSGAMARILDELLDLARMEARRGKDFRRTPQDLEQLAQDVIRSYKQPAGREKPELLAPPGPMPVFVDGGKLRQALLNVLSNAYKYSPAGGPVKVELRQRQAEGVPQVGVVVRDCGIGMTPEQKARVFERFYRADKSGRLPGTGLGMSIVKEIFELHQGVVEVESVFGQGTEVRMWLHAEEAHAPVFEDTST